MVPDCRTRRGVKKLLIALSALALGFAVFSMASLQRRVAELERQLAEAPSARAPDSRSEVGALTPAETRNGEDREVVRLSRLAALPGRSDPGRS